MIHIVIRGGVLCLVSRSKDHRNLCIVTDHDLPDDESPFYMPITEMSRKESIALDRLTNFKSQKRLAASMRELNKKVGVAKKKRGEK